MLKQAGIADFRFHDLRHTFASWYMMNGGDLYELAKILGHSNIKMTERYAKLPKQHITKTGSTARQMNRSLIESVVRAHRLSARILDDPPDYCAARFNQRGIVETKRPNFFKLQSADVPESDSHPARVIVGPPAHPDPLALFIDSARPRLSAAVIAAHNIGWPQAQSP